ncbi:Cyclin-dependent kinase F-4 [Spatholobus suberectus]|nr:Cyclin-dependent kinase F-4 [Spatholobus suberectus]
MISTGYVMLLSSNTGAASLVHLYKYKLIKEVGDGTFGSVWRAINKQTGEVSCFYIPPSLRSRAVARTPPRVVLIVQLYGDLNCPFFFSWNQRSTGSARGQEISGALPNSKLSNSFSSLKLHPPLASGVQRKLDMVNQDGIKNEIPMRTTKPKYRQPGKDSPSKLFIL